jgi:hypothetical protein
MRLLSDRLVSSFCSWHIFKARAEKGILARCIDFTPERPWRVVDLVTATLSLSRLLLCGCTKRLDTSTRPLFCRFTGRKATRA